MSTSITVNSSTATTTVSAGVNTPMFWERLWRTAGIQFAGLFIATAVIHGFQPGVGASSEALGAFYNGDRTRLLIAGACSGLNLLNLLWFVAAIRTTLADVGQDGWGAAATASSALLGGMSLLVISVESALAYSIAGAGNATVTSGLNDFAWALVVLMAFPRAMLIMSGVFGLWRGGLLSNAAFSAGVAVVVLGVLGGATWLPSGFWSPDGAYSRFVSPSLLLVWVMATSRVLLGRAPGKRAAW
jgi:hypothetical protein